LELVNFHSLASPSKVQPFEHDIHCDYVDLNEKKQNAFLALARAKQALELDLNDGESWYVLGNAHLTCFFLSDSNKSEDLNKALTAYNIAESKVAGEVKLDLLYNRATIYQYLEDYPRALEGYQQAATLDPSWAAPRQKIATIIDNTTRTQSLIQKKGNLKRKKIDELAARLKPLTATILSNYCSVLFRDLQLAFNSNVFVVGKVIAFVSNVTTIPFILVMIDASGEPIGVSIYNIRNDAIKYEDTLTIFDPYVLNVNITSKNHQAISYKVIQVHSIQKLHINGAPLKSTSYVHTDFNLLTSQQ
jgi:tetratricopeptide (TPR) repeat protein